MDPIEPPQEGAYHRVSSSQHPERAEAVSSEAQQLQAELAKLRSEIDALKNWRSNLKGRNGINVADGEISFDPRGARLGGGEDNVAVITVILNGGPADVAFKAQLRG